MKQFVSNSFFSGIVLCFGLNLIAGDKAGNGGGAFVCRSKGKITRAMNYDLWAGIHDGIKLKGESHYLNIERHNREPARMQALRVFERLEKLNSGAFGMYRQVLEFVMDEVEKLVSDEKRHRLPVKNDFTPVTYPEEDFCPDNISLPDYESAIVYYDGKYRGNSIIDGDLLRVYDAVILGLETETDLAALYIHETLYKADRTFFRRQSDSKSDLVRTLVAAAFSDVSSEFLNQVFLETYYPKYQHQAFNEFIERNQKKIIEEELWQLMGFKTIENFESWYEKDHYFLSQKIDFDRTGVVLKRITCQTRGIFGDADYYQHYTLLSEAVRNYNYELVKFLVLNKDHSPHEEFQTCGLFNNSYYMSTLEFAEKLDPGRKNKAAHEKILQFFRSF